MSLLFLFILKYSKNASLENVMCFSKSTFQVIKYDLVVLEIVKLIQLKRLQEFVSCVTTFACNRSTSLPINFIYTFFILQPLKSILNLP